MTDYLAIEEQARAGETLIERLRLVQDGYLSLSAQNRLLRHTTTAENDHSDLLVSVTLADAICALTELTRLRERVRNLETVLDSHKHNY